MKTRVALCNILKISLVFLNVSKTMKIAKWETHGIWYGCYECILRPCFYLRIDAFIFSHSIAPLDAIQITHDVTTRNGFRIRAAVRLTSELCFFFVLCRGVCVYVSVYVYSIHEIGENFSVRLWVSKALLWKQKTLYIAILIKNVNADRFDETDTAHLYVRRPSNLWE